jgi:putative redox protein
MQIKVNWIDKFLLQAETESGKQVWMDTDLEAGGDDKGPRPMELLLMALGGCTAMDVVLILKKKKADLNHFSIEVDGEKASQHPKYFTKINLNYIFEGKDLKEEDIHQAIELSMEKYCSVSAMLKEKTKITYRWDIRNS